jgi:peptide/nickel transport system permease protein
MSRASAIEVLRLEYITHARAKGVSEWRVLLAPRASQRLRPTWTLIGLVLGNLLGGIAVVETVFTMPGLGRLLVDSIFARDYPVMQGCLLFTAVHLCRRQPDRRPLLSAVRPAGDRGMRCAPPSQCRASASL